MADSTLGLYWGRDAYPSSRESFSIKLKNRVSLSLSLREMGTIKKATGAP